MRFIGGTALVIAALTLSGCAGTAGKATSTATATVTVTAAAPQPKQPVLFNQSTVVKYLHLTDDAGDYLFTAPSGKRCEVNVILTSAPAVDLYADDTIATNPARTAGVKVSDEEAVTCMRLITKALVDFPPAT